MGSKGALLSLMLLLLVLASTTPVCYGQATAGIITGVVRDPAKAAVPGASVLARNAGTGAEAKTETGADGFYRFVMQPGQYVVEVEAKGFRKTILSPQRLSVGDVLRQDVNLEIGAVTESITVGATATQVNTEDAQLGKVVRDPSNLPILSGVNGRNPLNLAQIVPGVVVAGQVGDFSVNGMRAQSNNFMLDGADANDLSVATSDTVWAMSPNAISEFRIVTGTMKAEYGRSSGASVLVETKSGGNAFHGLASEIFRNTKLNAVPFFQKSVAGGTATAFASGLPRKPQWNTNDYDANIGGPIVHDQTFFFVSYLGFRRRQGVTNSAVVPSDAQRALIMANGTPAAKKLLALIPSASTGNTLYSSPSNAQDRDQGIAKFNHLFSAANQFSATFVLEDRWLGMDPFGFQGSTIPGFGQTGTWKDENVILRDTHAVSPALINEFRAAYHRLATDSVKPLNHTKLSDLGLGNIVADDPSAEGPPWVSITGFGAWGNSYQGPQARFENTFQYLDNVSWTRRRHYVRFGGDFRSFSQNQRFTFIDSGYIIIDGSGTLAGYVPKIAGLSGALNDFANGFATLFVQNSKGRQGYRTRSANLFWQDDWKLKPNFALNFGVRWEYNAPMTEIHDQAVAFRLGQKSTVFPTAPTDLVYPGDKGIPRSTYPADWNNFAPRFGFAWDVLKNGELSVRGGYGLFYDIPITELTSQFLNVPPYGIQSHTYYTMYADPWATSRVAPIAQPFPFQPAKPGQKFDFTAYAPLAFSGVMDPHFASPYGQQFNLTVQYQMLKDWLMDLGYVGTSGTKLLNRREINPAVAGLGATVGNTDSRRTLNLNNPDAAAFGGTPLSGIKDQLTDANSIYNSLQVSVTKRFSHGLLMTHAYTWGHAIDNASGIRANDNGAPGRIDNSRLDRGNSEQDVRHRYVMTYQYELPWLKDKRGPLGFVLGGWEVDGITTFQTGLAVSVYEGEDRALTGTSGQRPDYIGGSITLYDPRLVSAVAGKPNSWFDGTGGGDATLAGSPSWRRVGSGQSWALGAGRYGNFGRNVFHGPGLNNFDIGASKTFRITERQRLQVRGEAFNLVNHTQFRNPNGNDASVNFGRVTTARDPRLIQLTLKYSF